MTPLDPPALWYLIFGARASLATEKYLTPSSSCIKRRFSTPNSASAEQQPHPKKATPIRKQRMGLARYGLSFI